MTTPREDCGGNGDPREKTREDLTGRDRLVWNVVYSWGAHFVFIVSGFIMPRMIDQKLGQSLLGIWDFGWSLVSYFQVVQLGVASSVNRYIAKYRAAGDTRSVNRVASSATFLLAVAGLIMLGLTIGLTLLLPELFGERLGEHAREAQWVVLFLGASMSFHMAVRAFSGVLTGCHRWDLHNINTSGWYAVIAVGMIVALLVGEGLPTLALVTLIGQFLADVRLTILAHRACEGLKVRPYFVTWGTIKDLYVFGGKTLLPGVAMLLLNQTTSILVVAFVGPAALALFSRPRSLMHHVDVLVRKMAMTLTPTTSSLQGVQDLREIQDLAIKSARYSFYLVMPIVLLLVVFGGPIMQLWMGPRYGNGLIPAILALGHLTVMVQLPVLNILVGMNAHGRVGVARLIVSVCSVGLNIVLLKYLGAGLVGTAIAVTLPLTILNLVDVPIVLCRHVGLSLRQYFLSIATGPILHALPFAAFLVGARLVFRSNPLLGLLVGGTLGGLLLSCMYWWYVVPRRLKGSLLSMGMK